MASAAVTVTLGSRPLNAMAPDFPRKADFLLPDGLVYMNSAYAHPLSRAAVEAMQAYSLSRARPSVELFDTAAAVHRVKTAYAALINATAEELAFIPNTSTGENLVVRGLGIPGSGGNVVTDALHFDGAILHLQALQSQGLELRMAMPTSDGRIELSDLDRLIDRDTRLVEVSSVAMYNGFEHDLRAVCELAHSRGAYVYADIIQGVGAVPFDARTTGVDFAAASGFKWLMGDFGLGFLYVRADLIERVLRRTTFGYHSAPDIETHFQPSDSPGPMPFTWEFGTGAGATYEVGSRAAASLMALDASLPYLRQLGVDRIQAWRQPLLQTLRTELGQHGFIPVTPPGTTSPILSFTFPAGRPVAERLKRAHINARVGDRYLRLSPSVFNEAADVGRVIEALG
ncbi:MAG: putative aminotransferase [Gemmatimonadetes bacterium]|nr:putative aminotransferase [Gemmatimonadota bacterium]